MAQLDKLLFDECVKLPLKKLAINAEAVKAHKLTDLRGKIGRAHV